MNYRDKPILVGTINGAGDEDGGIFGTAILKNELIVLSSVVKVYNVHKPFQLKRQWQIPGMKWPGDVKAWSEKNALIILDWTEKGRKKQMHVVDRDGINIHTWSMNDDFGRISITDKATIVVAWHDQNALSEYTLDGKEIHQIAISQYQGIKGLQHAIKLKDDRFLLSHGDPEDQLHRVCIVDGKGKLLKSFGREKRSGVEQLDVPVYLDVDRSGSVLVLDKYNGRVCLLSSELKFQKDLVTKEHGLRFPVRMHLDKDKGLLYVTDNERSDNKMTDGRVLVYKITDDE